VEYIYHFAVNLFRKQCDKFYQNRRSFIEGTAKIILVSFWTHCMYACMYSMSENLYRARLKQKTHRMLHSSIIICRAYLPCVLSSTVNWPCYCWTDVSWTSTTAPLAHITYSTCIPWQRRCVVDDCRPQCSSSWLFQRDSRPSAGRASQPRHATLCWYVLHTNTRFYQVARKLKTTPHN